MTADCITTVPTGHTGIVTTFGRVENKTFEAGVHAKAPWQQVVVMDNRIQKAGLEMLCFSSDMQEVMANYTVNYQIEKSNAQTIYKDIGQDYYNIVIEPRIQQAVKDGIKKYNAEELISNREILAEEIQNNLSDKLAAYNIALIDTSIENLDFSDKFTDAVEAKQVATQEKLTAQTQQERLTMEAEAQAQRATIEATAAAERQKIAAEAEAYSVTVKAEAEAEANAKVAASLTQELIDYTKAQLWNGEMPTVMGDATPILDMTDFTSEN
jgi:regulator of protease activity HflC (stomatin/prohibitin superfamily)